VSAIATVDESVVLVSSAPPATLFGTADPDEIIAEVARRATTLASVIKKQKLSQRIGGRDHVLVEGWTLLGTLLGVFPVCVWSRQLENGWEARVEARTLDGRIVGSAEAMCLRSERSWAARDEYALRSMAQTRATSKALRQPLGFVVTMAGFHPTPAEEMVVETTQVVEVRAPDPASPQAPAPASEEPPLASEAQAKNIYRLLNKLDKVGLVAKQTLIEAIGREYGYEDPRALTKAQASDLIKRLKVKAGEE
jgi:hypothetical protein